MERTLCLIKPDAVRRAKTGAILAMIEGAGLRIAALRMLSLTKAEAEGFYAVHAGKPFFAELTAYMCSGPIVAAVLEGEGAIPRYRELMGATDPAQAAPNTIRRLHAVSKTENSVHGSDAPDTARTEIAYFFSTLDQAV